jgi:hypothetical protein
MGSSARNDGLFRVIIVSGRILVFRLGGLDGSIHTNFLSRYDALPALEADAEDCPTKA